MKIDYDQYDAARHDTQIQPQLLIFENAAEAAHNQ